MRIHVFVNHFTVMIQLIKHAVRDILIQLIYWNIPVRTEMEIVDQRENWSKCICGGLTGWMKNEFIQTGEEEDPPIAPEPSVSEDPGRFEDPVSEPEPEQALTLLADVYQTLQGLCERILSVAGRG